MFCFFSALVIIVVVVSHEWCSIRIATIICEIAHQIATIRCLLNDDRFIFLLPFLWLRHVVILRYIFSLSFSLVTHWSSVLSFLALFLLKAIHYIENLLSFSLICNENQVIFMTWINAIKYVLNRHKKTISLVFSAVFVGLLAGWLPFVHFKWYFQSKDNDTQASHHFNQINHVKLNFSSVHTSHFIPQTRSLSLSLSNENVITDLISWYFIKYIVIQNGMKYPFLF